jgi:ech hydrogenase subunit B
MNDILAMISVVLYLVLAPVLGIILSGIDRKLSARLQGRKGPSVLQPYYDVRKLLEKEHRSVNNVQTFYVACFLLFMTITGCIFFYGGDLLLVIFTLTLSNVFLILAAYSSSSPYSQIGAEREIYQMMCYEPMVLLTAIGFYLVCDSYMVSDIAQYNSMPIVELAGIFIGFIFILTIKFRKSPFDLSMSHHAHQDLVRGMTTEFSGKTLAIVEVSHWYENIMLLGIVFLFFCNNTIWEAIIGMIICLFVYVLEIFIDNSFARMKWQVALKSAWAVALIFGVVNIGVLFLI